MPEARALDYVLGYAVGNDVSHRDWQLKFGGGQWSLGKGFDGWAPFGPGIVSSRLIADPQKLGIRTRVNGETVQDSTTGDMIFGIADDCVSESGDDVDAGGCDFYGDVSIFLSFLICIFESGLLIILWNRPQGVGMGRKPQVWLKDGDVVEVEVDGVGTCTNKVEFSPARDAKL